MIEIQDKALFIADSHYPHHGSEFLNILQQIDKKTINPTQLFLMGDNFDLLFGYNEYIQTFSKDAIELLQKLSLKLDIYYFEGNHDFCLKHIFTNIKIYSREEQPAFFTLNHKKVALSHGDKFATKLSYNIYTKAIRNRYLLRLLKPWSRAIIDDRMKKLSQKNICHWLHNFDDIVKNILNYYDDVDMVIEGHFHQAKVEGKYISLPSLACQKEVGVVEYSQIVFKTI